MDIQYRIYLKRKGITDFDKFSLTDDPKHPNPDGSFPIFCDWWGYDIPEPSKEELEKITEKEIQKEEKEIQKEMKRIQKEAFKQDKMVKLLTRVLEKLNHKIDVDEIIEEIL